MEGHLLGCLLVGPPSSPGERRSSAATVESIRQFGAGGACRRMLQLSPDLPGAGGVQAPSGGLPACQAGSPGPGEAGVNAVVVACEVCGLVQRVEDLPPGAAAGCGRRGLQ